MLGKTEHGGYHWCCCGNNIVKKVKGKIYGVFMQLDEVFLEFYSFHGEKKV